jgi:septum formation protein
MISQKLKAYNIILASRSPRRQHLLKELGIDFEVYLDADDNEDYPAGLIKEEIAIFLAEKKMGKLAPLLVKNNLVITADTIVWLNGQEIGKPKDLQDAFNMLSLLSGKMHTVYTGVCLATQMKKISFYAETDVYFRSFTGEEIQYYVEKYKPLDKAGAYGVQEWIGYTGVEKIHGSYFNVMGLPLQKLYLQLCNF